MAHLIFPEIQDALVGDSQHLTALVDAIQKCETAQDARHLARHIEDVAETLRDLTNMIDGIKPEESVNPTFGECGG